ncbi:MAG: insulinase family protein [Coxiellaceae bacterium]|nr:insulinase family protein [Coxiellaceae bacterium]
MAMASNDTYEYRLQNGLKLIVREDHRAPVVVSSVWYKVGGSYEHDGITGVSHMLEHMMFKGTKRFGPGVLIKKISDNGGQQNAMTSDDFTMYYQQLSADKLGLSFELEADRMRNLSLQKNLFDKEHQVVMEERRMRVDDNPQSLTWERFQAVAFVNNPYQHPTVGWMTDLKNLTLSDLKNWYETWYSPNNAVVVVVGDVKAAEVFNLAKKYFGPLKSGSVPKLKPRTEVASIGPRKITANINAKVPWLVMGYNVPVLKGTQHQWKAYALYVLISILDAGDSGRLQADLVRGKQIAVNIDGSYNIYSLHNNLLVIDAVPAANHSIKTLRRAILSEISRLQKQPVTEAELKRIKAQVITSNVYKKDSMMREAYDIGIPEMADLSWRDSAAFVSRIEAVTPKQVQAVANEFLQTKNLTVGVLQPHA